VVDSGLLRCAVAHRLGGLGGSLDDLTQAAALLCQKDPEAAVGLWAQRLAIEALVQSGNVGLRELWLPDFFSGARAATQATGGTTLIGEDTGRGWLLSGRLSGVPNLPWEGFSLVAPVRLGPGNAGWVLLRSEEDGLCLHPEPEAPRFAQLSLQLNRVFIREDEWLGGPEMADLLAPIGHALAPCRPCPPALKTLAP
jgi:alkylation response protein AidB-like acyl-CoA dehydrogenase